MGNPELISFIRLLPKLSTIDILQRVEGDVIIKPEKQASFDQLYQFIKLINVAMFDPSITLNDRVKKLKEMHALGSNLFEKEPLLFPNDIVGTLLIKSTIPNQGVITFTKEQPGLSPEQLSKMPIWNGVQFTKHIQEKVLPDWKI